MGLGFFMQQPQDSRFLEGFLDLGGRPPLRCLRFACKSLKYSEPRFATFLPPFLLGATAAGSFFFFYPERG